MLCGKFANLPNFLTQVLYALLNCPQILIRAACQWAKPISSESLRYVCMTIHHLLEWLPIIGDREASSQAKLLNKNKNGNRHDRKKIWQDP